MSSPPLTSRLASKSTRKTNMSHVRDPGQLKVLPEAAFLYFRLHRFEGLVTFLPCAVATADISTNLHVLGGVDKKVAVQHVHADCSKMSPRVQAPYIQPSLGLPNPENELDGRIEHCDCFGSDLFASRQQRRSAFHIMHFPGLHIEATTFGYDQMLVGWHC